MPGPPPGLRAASIYDADYLSSEINLVVDDPLYAEYQILVGLRYLDHGDAFAVDVEDAPLSELFRGRAENRMLGLHAGLRHAWWYRHVLFDVAVVGGVLNNRTTQSGPIYDSSVAIDGIPEPTFDLTDNQTSLLGEVQFTVA